MTNAEALRQLRRVVLDAPEDRLNMKGFGRMTECGAVCCAAGWAALDPWFLANTRIGEVLPISPNPRFGGSIFGFSITGPGLPAIFGLSLADANALFGLYDNHWNLEDVTRADVVANIDRLLRGEHAVAYGPSGRDGGR